MSAYVGSSKNLKKLKDLKDPKDLKDLMVLVNWIANWRSSILNWPVARGLDLSKKSWHQKDWQCIGVLIHNLGNARATCTLNC